MVLVQPSTNDNITAPVLPKIISARTNGAAQTESKQLRTESGFDQVSFVSVTRSFSATSSMGRLTLNVLLSFT